MLLDQVQRVLCGRGDVQTSKGLQTQWNISNWASTNQSREVLRLQKYGAPTTLEITCTMSESTWLIIGSNTSHVVPAPRLAPCTRGKLPLHSPSLFTSMILVQARINEFTGSTIDNRMNSVTICAEDTTSSVCPNASFKYNGYQRTNHDGAQRSTLLASRTKNAPPIHEKLAAPKVAM